MITIETWKKEYAAVKARPFIGITIYPNDNHVMALLAKKDIPEFREKIGKSKKYALPNDFFTRGHKTVLIPDIRDDIGYSFIAMKDLRDIFSINDTFFLEIPYSHKDLETDRPIALITCREFVDCAIIFAPWTDKDNVHVPINMDGATYEILKDQQNPMGKWA